MEKIILKSTSRNSALGEDEILREKSITRLIFRPEIVNNPHDKTSSVRGTFIFQRKKLSGKWGDYNDFPLSKLKDGEWIKLVLHAGAVQKLIDCLEKYKNIYSKYGIKIGENKFIIDASNTKDALLQLSNIENEKLVAEKLQELNINDLQSLNSVVGIGRLRKVVKLIKNNIENHDEAYWQDLFKNNFWVISQIFSYPVILFKDKAYLGGKGIDNKGASIIDFICKNNLTGNIALVEIKTPKTLILSSEYRKGVYSINDELSGTVVQILNYRDKLQKEYFSLISNSDEKFSLFNPKCIIIIGNMNKKNHNAEQIKSFELFRSCNKDIDIITYNELFNKIITMLNLLEGKY